MVEALLNEDYKDGMGIPFIALEGDGDDARFRVTEEAKEFLSTLRAPVALASIVGRYRTGKSLLVNRMLLDVKGKGFQVGATVNSCTKGLWLWNKPLMTKLADGSEVKLLIIDTEGIGSLDADADHDAKIFALALLLSSYFIYNSVGSIDESALNNLSLVVELTKHIRTKSDREAGGEPETGAEFANFFPHFLWVVRDFTLLLVDENGNPFSPKQYLERALTPVQGFSEGVEVKNRIRRMLLAFFPNRDCVTLKRPVEDESKLQQLDQAEWSDFRPEFVEQVKLLRRKIYSSAPAKTLNGKMLDGFMLSHLAETYATAINTGTSLNIGDAWTQVSKSKNVKAVDDARKLYEASAAELEGKMPYSGEELQAHHKELSKAADKFFREHCIGHGAELDPYITSLTDALHDSFLTLQSKNESVARQVAEDSIKEAYAGLASMVEAKSFVSFQEYEKERLKIRSEYMEKTPDTPAKLEVLLAFMEYQIPVAAGLIAQHSTTQFEKTISEKDEELRNLKYELENEKKSNASAVEEVNTKLQHAQNQMSDLQEREKDLKQELERAVAAHKKELEEETSKLKGELDTVKKNMDQELTELKEKAKKDSARAEEENSSIQKKLALAEQQSKFMEEEKSRLQKQSSDAAAEVESLRSSKQNLEGDLKALRDELAAAKDKVGELESKVKSSQEEASRFKNEISQKESEAKMREEDLRKTTADAQSQSAKELEDLKLTLSKTKAELEAANGKMKEMEDEVRKGQAEKGSLEREKASTQAAEEKLQAEKKELEESLSKLKGELGTSEEEHNKLKAQLAKVEQEAKASEGKVKEKDARIQELESNLAVLKASGEKQENAKDGASADADEMRLLLERQARMQEAFNEESTKLNQRIHSLEQECDRYKEVIHKLSKKVEAANAAGFSGEGVGDMLQQLGGSWGQAVRNGISGLGKRGENAGAAAPSSSSPSIPPECSTLASGRSGAQQGARDSWVVLDNPEPRSRPKNEIVFKPVQQDVFAQVARQTNRSTEEVYRAHEAGRSSQGVAAASVGSGEKFSFARLRAAISKKVTGAINKVDEWADNVEGVLLGQTVYNSVPTSPPRPADGGFYHEVTASPEDRKSARGVLEGLAGSWAPTPESERNKARREKQVELDLPRF
uniref:GB1/RHD3-type G domain-containing protein n=1 Tax=Guillardia theta TaxID=55529 RepID=A0A6U6DJ11_GUITH|mmetsp:Transcript_5754/g.20298  ORF Transcript_5754/g.20298 Transcript_5754/m.20298 type:complete len:1142 (+) Transcript_5754:99-3524(+)